VTFLTDARRNVFVAETLLPPAFLLVNFE